MKRSEKVIYHLIINYINKKDDGLLNDNQVAYLEEKKKHIRPLLRKYKRERMLRGVKEFPLEIPRYIAEGLSFIINCLIFPFEWFVDKLDYFSSNYRKVTTTRVGKRKRELNKYLFYTVLPEVMEYEEDSSCKNKRGGGE